MKKLSNVPSIDKCIDMKKKIGLHERMLLMHSAGNMRVGGIVRLIKRILSVTAVCELCGAGKEDFSPEE